MHAKFGGGRLKSVRGWIRLSKDNCRDIITHTTCGPRACRMAYLVHHRLEMDMYQVACERHGDGLWRPCRVAVGAESGSGHRPLYWSLRWHFTAWADAPHRNAHFGHDGIWQASRRTATSADADPTLAVAGVAIVRHLKWAALCRAWELRNIDSVTMSVRTRHAV